MKFQHANAGDQLMESLQQGTTFGDIQVFSILFLVVAVILAMTVFMAPRYRTQFLSVASTGMMLLLGAVFIL
ncbi:MULTISPECIES: hypothetical protein [Bacillus]|uniref:hypothetical protein n=1 Tax=Bacillus TaxID=1386 RepID=UPI000E4C5523|nr:MULTISPECIES: hypothetical protein [Bacillus subtilis group]MCY8636621.1 hypothetical protein [Bacillus sp. S17B2]MBT3123383.1 hypothetical protein [Bacillus inaquosorum]MCB4341348.1 hypothetical protein [Bacillus subtilis]MCB5337141.1 hypothetical protein [Bacillus amyloliquefaciens]MCF7615469.1 hypothetical protein [Bacillus subtilis]